jgi:hypothetical protein
VNYYLASQCNFCATLSMMKPSRPGVTEPSRLPIQPRYDVTYKLRDSCRNATESRTLTLHCPRSFLLSAHNPLGNSSESIKRALGVRKSKVERVGLTCYEDTTVSACTPTLPQVVAIHPLILRHRVVRWYLQLRSGRYSSQQTYSIPTFHHSHITNDHYHRIHLAHL